MPNEPDEPIELKPMAFFDKGDEAQRGLVQDFAPKIERMDTPDQREIENEVERQAASLHEGVGANGNDDPEVTKKVQNPSHPTPDEEALKADGAQMETPEDLIPDIGPDLPGAAKQPGQR